MRIAIGADHRGFEQKEYIKKMISAEWIDVGAQNSERSDYPVFAHKVCKLIIEKQADKGILLCGSGTGMSIAANRYKEIYAGLVWNSEVAQQSKEDDNTNVIVLASDYISRDQAIEIVTAWLLAAFKEGRYAQRVAMINELLIKSKDR